MRPHAALLLAGLQGLSPGDAAAQPTAPDVHVSSLKVTVKDRTATYLATVCNKGGSTATAFQLELWYARSSAPSCSTGGDNQWTWVYGLAAGKCIIKTFTYAAVAVGAQTAWALADGDCNLKDADRTNDARAASVTVAKPDLYISKLTATVSGTTVHYEATVCNKGSSQLTSFQLELWYDRSAAPSCNTGGDNQWAWIYGLDAGKCVSKTFTRAKATQGSYTAWALADAGCAVAEGNENNNARSVVHGAKADLYIAKFVASGASNGQLNYSVTLCNKGADTPAPVSLALYYHRSSTPSCGATAQHQWTVSKLTAGSCVTQTLARKGVAPGSYTAWVLADAACAVTEASEANNTMSAKVTVGQQPDLSIGQVSSAVAGAKVTITAQLCNAAGAGQPAKPVLLGLYYNLGAAPGCTTKRDQQTLLPALAPGACASHSFVRPATPPGVYVSWVMADADCQHSESTETNNAALTSYLVAQPKPDLGVPDLAPPDMALPDMAAPDMAAPDQAIPDAATADLAAPEAATPDQAVDSKAKPDQRFNDGAPLPDQAREGSVADSKVTTADGKQAGDQSTSSSEDQGCSCTVARPQSSPLLLLLLLLGAIIIRRRNFPLQ